MRLHQTGRQTGRARRMARANLRALSEGISAYALWLGVPRGDVREPLVVMPNGEGAFVWVAGFGGLRHADRLETYALRAPLAPEMARRVLWEAALSPLGVRAEALPLWCKQVQLFLPDDLLRGAFPQGFTVSALARHFGFARATVRRALR